MPITSALRPSRTWRGVSVRHDDALHVATALRVPRDHQLLVGGNDPCRDAELAARADARSVARVGVGVELDAEPGRVAADALAQRRAVLADAGGEHDRVEAAERGGKRAQLAADAIGEEIDGRLGARLARSPRACACRSRCRTRRAVPTPGRSASRSRARPCASSSMRYSTTPGSRLPQRVPIGSPSAAVNPIVLATLRPPCIAHMLAPLPRCSTTVLPAAARASYRRKRLRDVLVGKAVEAVAQHAALGDRARQRECLRHRGLVAMERGVEAGDLRQLRDRASSRSRIGARLCGWCSGASGTYFSSASTTAAVDARRPRVLEPAVHDPMPDRREAIIR